VLRGKAPRVLLVDGLRSGRELSGSPACRADAWVYARPGDRIAIAFRGRPSSEDGRVSSAAWLEGEPDRSMNPGLAVADVMPCDEPAPASLTTSARGLRA
jgi:hypothetical protein